MMDTKTKKIVKKDQIIQNDVDFKNLLECYV